VTWRTQAACRGLTHRMYLPVFEPLAKATCAACPVRVDCQADGASEAFGVWGGLTAAERSRVAVKRSKARQQRRGTAA
jgi:hypothetical protein